MKNETLAELKETADELGTTQVGLVKLCVVAFLRWVRENKIRRLPDDWAKIIEDMDGRKMRYKKDDQSTGVKFTEDGGNGGKKRRGKK